MEIVKRWKTTVGRKSESRTVSVVSAEDFDRVTAERNALQLLLNDLEEQNHSLEQRRHAEQQACQAAARRVEKMEGLLHQASMLILDAELLRAIDDALNPTAEAVSHDQ